MTEIQFKPARKEEECTASQKEIVGKPGMQLDLRSHGSQSPLIAGFLPPDGFPPHSLGMVPSSARLTSSGSLPEQRLLFQSELKRRR